MDKNKLIKVQVTKDEKVKKISKKLSILLGIIIQMKKEKERNGKN